MSEAARQAALAALRTAQAAAARISPERDAEDVAADLIETWSSLETSLRALLNGSPLSGQDLVRDVRQREMLTLTQAHALLDFLHVRERLDTQTYQPTSADIESARTAITQLTAALTGLPPAPAAVPPLPSGPVAEPVRPASVVEEVELLPPPARRRGHVLRRVPVWAWALAAAAIVVIVGTATFFAFRDRDELASGRQMLREGRREAARAEFERVVRQNPQNAEAHIFLARMSRDGGDLVGARRHAEAAVRADPENGLAHREMGVLLYQGGNYQLARSFLERAIRLRPEDPVAQGVMGCTLIQLGQFEVGNRFLTRAGPGPWRECAALLPAPR